MIEKSYGRSGPPAVRAGWRGEGLALLALAAVAVLLFWRLALTNLIVGRGDLFFYFYPYRDYASAALRAGRLPLWNPYLFMGVPFLANSQAGFFYPLNLALAWLPVERMVNASVVLHAVLAAAGAYLWGRARLGLTRSGAWLAGLVYGLGGYFVAQVEHLNQIQVLAWLPWLLWLFQWRAGWEGFLRAAGMAFIVALQLLAGHTQSVFICLVGLAAYAWLPPAWEALRRRAGARPLLAALGIVAVAVLAGAGLAAVQLVPTFELSQLSVRGGGLPFKEALSFSLRPGMLGRALLPGWDAPLFPEFVAYVGVSGLALALAGAVAVWKSAPSHPRHLSRRGALVLAGLGLFLALGGYNPVYLALVKLVPGFDLFRAPARWLALYTIGMAGLAGIGLDRLVAHAGRVELRVRRAWAGAAVLLAGLVLAGWLLGGDQDPDLAPPLDWLSVAGWLGWALFFGGALYAGRRLARRKPVGQAAGLLVVPVLLELLGASSFLPVNRATAPGALTSLRPSVAHLLGDAGQAQPGPPARFLSISDIFFDPGDKPEIEINLDSQLSPDAVYDYLIATKQKEVLIPNLPLYYRLPAMDGYDGGVLPLRRYVTLERLFMGEEGVALDGRLRENLDAVPDATWLSLFNVRSVITDKVGDAWFDDVFYDLQMGARLAAGEQATVGEVPSMAATALGVVYRAPGAVPGTPLAEVALRCDDGQRRVLTLVTAAAAGEGDQVARLRWAEPGKPVAIEFRGLWDVGALTIRGASLIDERTGAFRSLVLSDSGRYRLAHSGDVKIYENLDVRPRLFFVPQAVTVADDEAALAVMGEVGFDPFSVAVLAGDPAVGVPGSAPAGSAAGDRPHSETTILLYEPERVLASVTAPTDGWLFLSDAWYPGWEARVDGRPVRVERADILFRAVAVAAGSHQVELLYRPRSFQTGVRISVAALGLLVLAVAIGLVSRRPRSPRP
jgi:hypothetical protein